MRVGLVLVVGSLLLLPVLYYLDIAGRREEAIKQEKADAQREIKQQEESAKQQKGAEAAKQRQEADLEALRKTDIDAYLKLLMSVDRPLWEQELKVLRPKGYAAYKAKEAADRETAKLKEAADRQAAIQAAYRKNPVDGLALSHSWYKGGFDNVMISTFTLKSALAFPIKDIKIVCVTSGPSGTELSAVSTTIYQNVQAKSTARFADVNMGFINPQSSNAHCEVLGVRQ